MKEMIINIPEESSTLVTELVEKLGGSVKKEEKEASSAKKKKHKAVEHDFLFGKWKDFDIDARKIREELWEEKLKPFIQN